MATDEAQSFRTVERPRVRVPMPGIATAPDRSRNIVTTDHPIFGLAARFVDETAALSPMAATYIGVDGHDHRWGDLGPDGVAAEADLFQRTRGELDTLPAARNAEERLAIRALRDHLDPLLDDHAHGEPFRDLSHIASTVPEMRDLLEVQDTSTPEGQDALAQRLETLPDALACWRRRLEAGMARDVLAARRQVRSVAGQLRDAVSDDGAFPRRADRLRHEAPQLTARLGASLPALRRAAENTADWLESVYLPAAPRADAVGWERYQRALHGLLGTDLDIEEAYDWAWDELQALLDRAGTVAARIDPDAGLADILGHLRTDPTEAAPSPERFRDLMQERQTIALESLSGEHVDVPAPIRHVDVKLAPPGGALGADYIGPSEDLTRPGSIWWSLRERTSVPLFEEVSTAYHEGFPGHHLQIGLQVMHADRLSRAHRLMIWNPGYGEGWTLYSETLMDELGFLERPAYELGYLTSPLLRVLRVVIDIGLHLEKGIPASAPFAAGQPWSFDAAVQALIDIGGLDEDYAVSEVTRYLGWPGQAISYAIGQREILRLREQRRQRDGDAFDLKAFHADVLGSGPVGLDHLRDLVF